MIPGPTPPPPRPSEADQRRLDLLEANHTFPGEFPLTVIARNDPAVAASIVRSVEDELGVPLDPAVCETRLSSGAKYVSHRLRVPCATAADVLRLYARVRAVDGVMTVL